MKISTEIGSASRRIGEERVVEYVAKAGFDAWDFSMFDMCRYDSVTKLAIETGHPLTGSQRLAFARKLKQIGLDNGIHCNQSHAPFSCNYPSVRSRLKWAIECTAEAGGKICVIHPQTNKSAKENTEFYMELLPFAKECGVKIATENMWDWDPIKDESSFAACATTEDFLAHLQAVNDDYFVACLDLGHADMRGSGSGAANMIRGLGSHLQALHIHDNDGWHDSHAIPFSMSMNYEEVVKALKDINYQGYLTLEADTHLKKYEDANIYEGIKEMAASARKLAAMFEE